MWLIYWYFSNKLENRNQNITKKWPRVSFCVKEKKLNAKESLIKSALSLFKCLAIYEYNYSILLCLLNMSSTQFLFETRRRWCFSTSVLQLTLLHFDTLAQVVRTFVWTGFWHSLQKTYFAAHLLLQHIFYLNFCAFKFCWKNCHLGLLSISCTWGFNIIDHRGQDFTPCLRVTRCKEW